MNTYTFVGALVSVLGGDFIIQQLGPLKAIAGAPSVFTTPPDF